MAQNRLVQKRQAARAERMARELKSDTPFGYLGMLRCGLSIVLFLLCLLVFMICANVQGATPLSNLEYEYRYVIPVGCSLLCVLLLLPSFSRHRIVISIVSFLMLLVGAVMPHVWNPDANAQEEEVESDLPVEQTIKEKTPQEPEPVSRTELSQEDLAVYRELCQSRPHQTHYAIYLTNQDSSTRTLVRESLARLLQAEYSQAYTRANGALYVLVNARRPRNKVAGVAAKYGNVVYANAGAGVYEVEFSAEKANLVSPYAAEVLTSPQNPNFVAANISELLCLDPMRVGAAAGALSAAKVQFLKRDIRDAVLQALNDPWDTEDDVYQSLVEALTVYAPSGDEEAVKIFRSYFDSRRALRKGVSPIVIRRLISEQPDDMVEPIVQLWSSNPVVWNEMISALGSRAEELLLPKLKLDADLQLLDSVLKYLASFGSRKSVPALEELKNHPDSLIRHKAEKTLESIQKRFSE